jgi:hypothetical protein
MLVLKKDSGWGDLNSRPLGPEPSTLATALQPVKKSPVKGQTGATGLEPAISGLTGRRDNQSSLRPLIKSTIFRLHILVKW